MDNIITLRELESIILERVNNITSCLNEELLNDCNINFNFKEFKKHNRLNCRVWLSILPYDLKIYLTKENIINKAPFSVRYKNEKVLGKKLILETRSNQYENSNIQ